MGPAFFLVVAGGARWIIAAVALGLLIASGRAEGLIPSAGLQILVLYGAFALTDAAAGMAIYSTAPNNVVANEALRMLGQVLGFGLPLLLIALLLARLNIAAPMPAAHAPVDRGIRRDRRDRAARVLEHPRQDRGGESTPQRGMVGESGWRAPGRARRNWPHCRRTRRSKRLFSIWWRTGRPDVRSDAFVKLEHRPPVYDELRPMLSGPNRDLSLAYMAQLSDSPPAEMAAIVRDRLIDVANEWRDRARAGSLSDDQIGKLGRQCELGVKPIVQVPRRPR